MFVCGNKAKKCASAFSLSNARYDHMSWYPLGWPVVGSQQRFLQNHMSFVVCLRSLPLQWQRQYPVTQLMLTVVAPCAGHCNCYHW